MDLMATNSFKELGRENEKPFEERESKVRHNVNHSIGFFHFIGDILELFIPKFFNIFVNITGGNGPKQEVEGDAKGGRSSDDDGFRPKYPNTF